jgi:hypothetical protein
MRAFKSVEAIKAWQRARELTRQIHTVSNRGAFSKDFDDATFPA